MFGIQLGVIIIDPIQIHLDHNHLLIQIFLFQILFRLPVLLLGRRGQDLSLDDLRGWTLRSLGSFSGSTSFKFTAFVLFVEILLRVCVGLFGFHGG